jgi:hypothetical protein
MRVRYVWIVELRCPNVYPDWVPFGYEFYHCKRDALIEARERRNGVTGLYHSKAQFRVTKYVGNIWGGTNQRS